MRFRNFHQILIAVVMAWIFCSQLNSAWTADISEYYQVESVNMPAGLDPQVGGLDFTPDGRLVACFHRGEVYTYNPKSGEWRLFAEGLQEPLGVCAVSNNEMVIMQRSELTRIQDLDLDGLADNYETLWDGFGMTGNYHEFAFGPVRDPDGNFIVSLNLASNGASIRPEVRGEFSSVGLPENEFYDRPWKEVKNAAGRMYSRVPWRGWVISVSPLGEATPIASGFRSPNGMAYDLAGNLFVTDNQGDWIGTSKCYHVKPGQFYGHPASLVWRKGWTRDPLTVPVEELNAMRTPASWLFPQGEVANSPTQPLCITEAEKFGPFYGQMLVGEMNVPRILRLAEDKVNGVIQGAVIPFLDQAGLRSGNNRLVFAPDSSLYVGQTALSWAGSKGIQRISWKGKTPPEIHTIKAKKDGFSIHFTLPIDLKSLENLKLVIPSWRYIYHKNYGSPKVDQKELQIIASKLSDDRKSLFIETADLEKDRVYGFDLTGLNSRSGNPIVNPTATYFMVEKP